MIAHFNQNPMLGDGKVAFNMFKKKYLKVKHIEQQKITKPNSNIVDVNYLEPFFVGLLEGDGYVKNANHSLPSLFAIELKDLPKNVYMLSLIKNYVGGTLYFYTKTNKRKDGTTFTVDTVKWYVKSKKAICTCLEIISKYPFLTSNKICQLKYFKQSIPSTCHSETSDQQKQIIEQYNRSFIIPRYFGPWLSGFIESEGCFTFEENLVFSIGQNNDYYIIDAIKTYYKSNHTISVENRNQQSTFYKIQITNSECHENIIRHIDSCPLLGNKQHAYEQFRTRYNVKNGILT